MKKEIDKKASVSISDPQTGDTYTFEGTGDIWQDGENWGGNISITSSKTELVLFHLARYVASVKEDAPGVKDARRILQTVYQKLKSFTIGLKDDGSFFSQWIPKEGKNAAIISREMEEIIDLPIFRAFVWRAYNPEKPLINPGEVEISKGGGGVRVGAQWGKARFEVKKAKKEKRKASPEDMPFEFTLLKLLRDYSTHRDKEHELYLLGNGGEEFEEVAAAIEGKRFSEFQRVAVMEIPQTELYKAYTGKPSAAISRDERRRVDKLLETFQSDIVTAIIKEPQPNKTVKWYEMAGPKITVARVATLTEEEAATREAGGDLPEAKTSLKIRFHPAFTFDIREIYGLLPDDYLQRMKKAIGGGRSGAKYWLLVDYLNGIRGHGKASGYETLLDFDTAALLLDLERFKKKQGIPATAAEIDEAARVAQEIGLVLSWAKERGARGQRQYQFKLNPEFGKE